MAAADDFFGDPPQRVAGPPFDTATALVAGTPADTVSWYTGEDGTDPARATATARVDPSITVSYGLRANEQGIRWIVQNIAALAAVTFSPSDPNAAAQQRCAQPAGRHESGRAGRQQKIAGHRGRARRRADDASAAADRHDQTEGYASDMLEQIEGVPTEQVAAQILALQTGCRRRCRPRRCSSDQPRQLPLSLRDLTKLGCHKNRPGEGPAIGRDFCAAGCSRYVRPCRAGPRRSRD